MEIEFTSKDFTRLARHSGRWTPKMQAKTDYEDVDSSAPDYLTEDWGWAYWIGPSWVDVKFATTWLTQQGEEYEVGWDAEEDEYVILTNHNIYNNKGE